MILRIPFPPWLLVKTGRNRHSTKRGTGSRETHAGICCRGAGWLGRHCYADCAPNVMRAAPPIYDCRYWPIRCLPAANAVATTVATRTDPTRGTTTVTRESVTRRQFDDRGCVLERMDAGSSVLCACLQGHYSQHERRFRQHYHEFSHKTSLPCRTAEIENATSPLNTN
jgi:hypothetical protein